MKNGTKNFMNVLQINKYVDEDITYINIAIIGDYIDIRSKMEAKKTATALKKMSEYILKISKDIKY